MSYLLKKWDEFWFSRLDPVSVSVFRISLGVLMFFFYIANFPNWERFYAVDGIVSLDPSTIRSTNWYSIFSWTEGIIPIKVYWWIGLFSTVAFTLGFQTRLVTIILYVLQTSMNMRNWVLINGEDHIFRMVLFYSCFSPLNHTLSLDSFFRKNISKEKELPLIWPIRMMQINILLIYVINIPNKLTDDFAWINGEAIYWTMANNMWSHQIFTEYFYKWDCLLSKISSYGTILVEGLFPVLVWFRETKLIALLAISSLHLGIAFLIPNVTFFTLAMVCSFWIFVPSELTQKILNSIPLLKKT